MDFERRNMDSTWSDNPPRLNAPYHWATGTDRRRSGEHTVTLTHVGFSADRHDAVVEVGVICGGLCGYGTLVFLRLGTDNVWHITRKYPTWVS